MGFALGKRINVMFKTKQCSFINIYGSIKLTEAVYCGHRPLEASSLILLLIMLFRSSSGFMRGLNRAFIRHVQSFCVSVL